MSCRGPQLRTLTPCTYAIILTLRQFHISLRPALSLSAGTLLHAAQLSRLLPHPPPPSDDCECAVAFRSCCAPLFDIRGVMCLTCHPDFTAAACPTHHPSSPTQVTSACNTLARTPCANC
ncbi:hypothetical protein K438DRAFT_2029917 [Mycena galopus ATCC 62051]|nr:hypothetical protein K438DRAFT_2029917 [Mycena galopus ATCC 62051]